MPLTLITGPANAAKAGAVFDAVREAAPRGPLLVVPTGADADRYRRELVGDGAVLGVRVVTFDGLIDQVVAAAGLRERPLSALARRLLAEAAIERTELERLAPAAATAGFAPALARLADELAALRITPQRLIAAVRAADLGGDPERRAYHDELAALVAADARLATRLGVRTATARAVAALDALRVAPALWGRRPVFLYGFDDLTPVERDAVETLAGPVDADVTIGLTFEAGRDVFAARAGVHQDLVALGADERALPPLSDHYAPAAREALHGLERRLWSDAAAPERCADAAGVRALVGGGERAELELAAAEIAQAIAAGADPDGIAVVHRGLDGRTTLVRRVFAAAGVPIALRVRTTAGTSSLGRALAALLRCAVGEGEAADLLAYLRAPGVVRDQSLVDRFEAGLRRQGIRDAARARAEWERAHWPLDALTALADVVARGDRSALYDALDARATALLAAPLQGRAARLDGAHELDARAVAAIRRALAELAALPEALAPPPTRLPALLAGLPVTTGGRPRPGAVVVARPQDLRARRVRTLYCLGLQQDVFPQPARPEPLLDDRERGALNAAAGLRLPLAEDAFDVERLFFYAAISRPTDELVLGWHEADDDAAPSVRSLFVDDVAALLPDDWVASARVRRLGAAGWPPQLAPTEREAARYACAQSPPVAPAAIAPLAAPATLAALAGRHTWSASGLELWLSCPVRWFVERWLRPALLEPDPEQLVRGDLAHRVLERVMAELVTRPGGLPATTTSERRTLTVATLERLAVERPLSVTPERLRTELRRLELDLLAYVDRAATSGSELTPSLFEVAFGRPEDDHPPLELGDEPGELRLAGRIDRIDLAPDHRTAVVYDYKGRSAPAAFGRWVKDGRLQPALYLLAARELLGLDVAGTFYQPLGAADGRPRGMLLADVDPGLDVVAGDRVGAEQIDELTAAVRGAARTAADAIRAGALVPRPERCGFAGGGCAHPTICRCQTT